MNPIVLLALVVVWVVLVLMFGGAVVSRRYASAAWAFGMLCMVALIFWLGLSL